MRLPRTPAALLALAAALLSLPSSAQAQDGSADGLAAGLHSLHARSVGPAGMAGRVASVVAVPGQPDTMFAGAATGGVWRSDDGGVTWQPVFDDQPVQSIGAIAVSPSNPAVVWVGTGEGNPRNSAGVGNGVYRSVDGGRTWTHVGLEKSERIHRIVVDPRDPDIAYAGAMGPEWSDGEERGVFKTTDGGRTWKRVLFTNASSGVSDLVMDPSNPDKLFAAMWDFRRKPWTFRSGGPGSGLFVTRDGGETWTRLSADDGLPAGELGRIGVAVAASDPDIVTAVVEAKKGALVRSYDGGRTWKTLTDDDHVLGRPFYYADIRVDPTNENRIYSLNSQLWVSQDEGRSWELVVPSGKVHGDVQDLWLGADGRMLVYSSDGGVAISRNRGRTWRWVENLPVGQFYHIAVDDAVPFNLYGGMQDNGSWLGPSSTWTRAGIRNAEWTRVGGGDGMGVINDPTDAASGYGSSQNGSLFRFDRVTGEGKDIQPVAPEGGEPLRFNWNAALTRDPFDPATIYLGSQYLHRSTDRGETWETISPDLTTDDPEKQKQAESGGLTIDDSGAENHTTIMTIAPSPVQKGVIWVGTDDGNIQLTRDAGETWTNVVGGVPGVPKHTWVSHIEASPHEAGTAFVTLDDHRRGNWQTYVYRTDDFGRSWTSLARPDVRGFAQTIEQDPAEPRLLFLGTEFGMWASLDAGAHWIRWNSGIPSVPVRGLAVQARDGDLAVGTHGRAAYVLDDIRPLRELAATPSIRSEPVHLFQPPVAWIHERAEAPGYRSTGDALYEAENRPYGALISYWVHAGSGSSAADTARIQILQGDSVVRDFHGPAGNGLQRVAWDLRLSDPPSLGGRRLPAPEVVPGRYAARVIVGTDTSRAASFEVRADPRTHVADTDRQAKLSTELAVQDSILAPLARLNGRVAAARSALRRVQAIVEAQPPGTAAAALGPDAQHLGARLQEAEDALDAPGDEARSAWFSLQSSVDAPTATERTRIRRAAAALATARRTVEDVLDRDVEEFSRKVAAAGLSLFPDAP